MKRCTTPSIAAIFITTVCLTALFVPLALAIRHTYEYVARETAACVARGGDPVRLHGPVVLCFEKGILL